MAGFDSASVQTLYDTAKDEYNNERERSSTIDTKASIIAFNPDLSNRIGLNDSWRDLLRS